MSRRYLRLLLSGAGALFAVFAVFSMLTSVARAGAPTDLTHDIVFLVDNSPSIRTGEGAPDGARADPDDLRIRMARFVVKAMSLADAVPARLAVISFAGAPETLMPLTSVWDWSKADLAAVRAIDQGTSTDFDQALRSAADMLLAADEQPCSAETRRCDIVLLTDGDFNPRPIFYPPGDIHATLQELSTIHGIEVHVLIFGDDTQGTWRQLYDDGLVSTYLSDIVNRFRAAPSDVYLSILERLGVQHSLVTFTATSLDGSERIALAVPPHRRWLHYQVIADTALTTTFYFGDQRVKPLVGGADYFLFQPQPGNWTLELEADGMVFHRLAGEELAECKAALLAVPEILLSGEDLTVQAELRVDGVPILDMEDLTILAEVSSAEGIGGSFRMCPAQDEGVLAATIPADSLAMGTNVLTVSVAGNAEHLSADPAVALVRVLPDPTISMTVSPHRLNSPTQTVTVLVSVKDAWPSSQLTLYQYSRDGLRSWPLTLSSGKYVTSFGSLDEGQSVGFWVDHRAIEGNRIHSSRSLPQMVEVRNETTGEGYVDAGEHWDKRLLTVIPCVLLLGGGMVGFLVSRVSRWSKIREIRTHSLRDAAWIRQLSAKGVIRNRKEIVALAGELARKWGMEYWNLHHKSGQTATALRKVLDGYPEFHELLQNGNQVAVAVVVWAGLLVSCQHSSGQDHIEPWIALEGYEGMNGHHAQDEHEHVYVGKYLDTPEAWSTLLTIWNMARGETASGRGWDDEALDVWRRYHDLTASLMKGGQDVEEKKERLLEVMPDGPLRRQWSMVILSELGFMGAHPVLENADARL